MKFLPCFPALLIGALLSASIAAQTLQLKDALKKKNLGALQSEAAKKTGQVSQAVSRAPVPALNTEGRISLIGDLSDADEQALGRETAGRILAASPVAADDELQQYVNRVGVHVAGRSARKGLAWTFAVIQSEDINAFAAPGGYVLLTAGLQWVERLIMPWRREPDTHSG